MQTSMSHPKIRTCIKYIYKTFCHLDYGDIIHEKVCNSSFHQKIESVQHNACPVIALR